MKKQWLIILFIFLVSFNSISQSKVAHIDTYELITSMPEMIEVQKELEKQFKAKQNEVRLMEAELKSLLKKYEIEVPDYSPEENQSRLEEIQGMEENIRMYMNQIYTEIQKKEEELTGPIMEALFEAIQAVGKEQGFDYVIDSSKGQGVILANGKDLMNDVKIYLGF
tara:strand:- start:37 stop:537 length:501 start_codon:yes stop_codon:yes gene_type:complete